MYNIFSERSDFNPHSKNGLFPGGRTPEQEEEPLPVLEEVTPHITDEFLLNASVSLSVSLRSPPELPPCHNHACMSKANQRSSKLPGIRHPDLIHLATIPDLFDRIRSHENLTCTNAPWN